MEEFTLSKLARNEALFREVNERISDVREDWGVGESRYICECASQDCFETVALSHDEYRRIRANDRQFFVLPGHELPELERVLERHARYLLVEKRLPVPAV